MIILSILIPTIIERSDLLTRIYASIYTQRVYLENDHPSLGDVEVLIDNSKRYLDGGPSIGKKRESLVRQAKGKYLCFLDDDEQIAGNYLETLVRLCQSDADVITFRSLANLETYWCVVDMSLRHKENEQTSPDIIAKRPPWHICPVKSYLAKTHRFDDSNYGEDWKWFEKVLSGCETEAKTNAVIHMYNHRSNISEADKITNHELHAEPRAGSNS